jgi:hypothetical protein
MGSMGKENQDELLGEDNTQDFGARMYDGRVGRWWGLDQKRASFPSMSPYCGLADNPNLFVDPDGKANTIYIAFTKYGYEQFFGNGALNWIDMRSMMQELEDAVNFILGPENIVDVKFLPDENLSQSLLDPSDAVIVIGDIVGVKQVSLDYFETQPNNIRDWKGAYHNNPETTYGDFVCIDADNYGYNMYTFGNRANHSDTYSAFLFSMLHGIGHTVKGGHTNDGASAWGKKPDEFTRLMHDAKETIRDMKNYNINLSDIIHDPDNVMFRDLFKGKFSASKPSDNYLKNKNGWGRLTPERKASVKTSKNSASKPKGGGNKNNHTRSKNPRFL